MLRRILRARYRLEWFSKIKESHLYGFLIGFLVLTAILLARSLHEPIAEIIRINSQSSLPRCVIIGAVRCGVLPLVSFLRLHPSIIWTGRWFNFFNHDPTHAYGIDWYSQQFTVPTGGEIIVDANSNYFHTAKVPARVRAMDRYTKVIIILRDPIKRMLSDYAQAVVAKSKEKGVAPMMFNTSVIEPASGGITIKNWGLVWSVYHAHLARWLRYFPLNQIHVIDGEELIDNPTKVVQEIEGFLGLKHEVSKHNFIFNHTSGYFCLKGNESASCFGHGKGWNWPYVDQGTLLKLQKFFNIENEKLFSLIGKRFHWSGK